MSRKRLRIPRLKKVIWKRRRNGIKKLNRGEKCRRRTKVGREEEEVEEVEDNEGDKED